MFYPVNIKPVLRSGYRNDIEPALVILAAAVLLQEGFRGFTDFVLFPACDTFFRSAKSTVFSIAYLDKYQVMTLPHDQVDFAAFS